MATATAGTTTGNTAGTMSTDYRRTGLHEWHVRGILLLCCFSAVALLALTFPRIVSYAAIAPAAKVAAALDLGFPVAREDIVAAESAYTKALAWSPRDARILHDHARVARRLAYYAESRPEGAGQAPLESADFYRQKAIQSLRDAAAAAPANGTVWALLARTELDRGAAPRDVTGLLNVARLTAPSRASALLLLHGISMRHWHEMPDETRNHALANTHLLWAKPDLRPVLIESYLAGGLAARSAFRSDMKLRPGGLEQFDRQLSTSLRRRR